MSHGLDGTEAIKQISLRNKEQFTELAEFVLNRNDEGLRPIAESNKHWRGKEACIVDWRFPMTILNFGDRANKAELLGIIEQKMKTANFDHAK